MTDMDEKMYILAVDDNQENLKVVNNFLKEAGYQIALALDGKSALKILENTNIDLILLDVMMPGMDGYEVCRLIKQNKKLKDIPVIFLTALNDFEKIVKGFQSGGVDYITKPFNYDELLIRVKTHLDLSRSKKRLQESMNTRDKLYSIIAHDIRTPFANITMLIDAMTEGVIVPGTEEFNKVLNDLGKMSHETTTLLNNLLDWTRLQVGTLTLKPRNLEIWKLIDECIRLFDGIAQNKHIELKSNIEKGRMAFFDEVTIHTVFRNLISNAIKFTPENGKILIESELSDKYVLVHVNDNGIGMSDEVIRRIFDHNESFTSRGTGNEKGAGLGLHLVKDMVEKNNGRIAVQSILGKGTTVTVYLPAESAEPD